MSHQPYLHIQPNLCLEKLEQRWTDGGREEYLQQQKRLLRYEPEKPTGDCVVVALVHAQFNPPTGQEYGNSRDLLRAHLKPWMYDLRTKNENQLAYFVRRAIQLFRPPVLNPIHYTPSHATASRLRSLGYQIIYPNDEGQWYCICDETCTYVLDVQIPLGDHTFTVHQMIAHTTAPFDPNETEVANVYRLNETKTREIKAWSRYKEAENTWYQRWAENGESQFPSWDDKPKLEDYYE